MIGRNQSRNALCVVAGALVLLGTASTTAGFQPSVAVVPKTLVESPRGPPQLVAASASRTPTLLSAASTVDDGERVLDTEALAKYAGAIGAQMLLIFGLFSGLDAVSEATGVQLPFAANFFLFFVLALKSRIFNPLSNERPVRETREIESDPEPPRKMPEWTPPGVVFPIVWILLIGPLRAASSAILVTSAGASYASPAILALMLHLSIGDTWNTINNVERRYGTSVVGVACVWASAAFAAYSYGGVDPLAGKLLSLPLIWLTIASSLIVRTWQLNPDAATGAKESFLPTKPAGQEGSITKLVWFEGTE